VQAVYDRIGTGYDATRRADPAILSTFADLPAIGPRRRFLDAARGTGNYTVRLARRDGDWFALGQSERTLCEARASKRRAPMTARPMSGP